MVSALASVETSRVDLLGGFLEGLAEGNGALVDALLDESLVHPVLVRWLPVLQRSTPLDERALARLHRVLDEDSAPIGQFLGFAYGRVSDEIPVSAFKHLVTAIARKPDGMAVGIEILSMRLHSDKTAKRPSAPDVLEAGRETLGMYQLHRTEGRMQHEDYALGTIARPSLAGDLGRPVARRLCRDLVIGVAAHTVYAHDYGDLLGSLFEVHPSDVLDELFGGRETSQRDGVRLLDTLRGFRQAPLDSVDDDTIVRWCDIDPSVRYPIMAAAATLFRRPSDQAPHEWTPLAKKLLVKAPHPSAVLNEMAGRLFPRGGWSGSLATTLESRAQLLNRLDVSGVVGVAEAYARAREALDRQIDEERRRETEQDRRRSERFE